MMSAYKNHLPRTARALFFIIALVNTFRSAAQVSGVIFSDYNANGIKENSATYNEDGLAEVVVNAFNPAGAALTVSYTGGGAATNSTGGYSVPGAVPGQVRLEFALPNSFTFASSGSAGGTTVVFPSGATQNLAVNYPQQYCNTTDPKLATPCYINGDPLQTGTAASGDVFVGFPFSATGYDTPTNLHSKADSIGSTWGVAYRRSTQTLYTSAFLKRYVGLGPLGIGGIYTASTAAVPSATRWLDVKTIGIDVGTVASNAARALSANSEDPSHDDPAVFDQIGKVGMGDMDISDDDKTLFLTNLYDRKVYSIFIDSDNNPATKPTVADVQSFEIPDPGCAHGVARPWGLKIYQGKVYVGVVCTGENAGGTVGDLWAYIYSMDISGGLAGASFSATPAFSFPLNYKKLPVEAADGGGWETWTADYLAFAFTDEGSDFRAIRPQPILSDIEFDVDGSMILIFIDRTGHQYGLYNYSPDVNDNSTLYNAEIGGDILRVASVGGVFQLEHNGTANMLVGALPGNDGGPGTLSGSSYSDPSGEFYDDATIATVHQDCTQGGAALLSGSGRVIACSMDPINWTSGGLVTWDNSNGTQVNQYQLYGNTGTPSNFGKANGLGDLELLCDPQPLEIGNRVWSDANSNGIQDAGEPGIDGLTIELWKGVTKVGQTTTANGGQYFFTNSNVNLNGAAGILPNMGYDLRLALAQAPISALSLTTPDAGVNDGIDSDGSASGANAVKSLTTGSAGENNHSFDFGFMPACTQPSGLAFSQTAASCTASLPNNDGSISLTAATDVTHFGVSTLNAASYDGPVFSSATAIGSLQQTLQNSIPNTGGSYIVRIFNGADNCFKDTTMTVAPVNCSTCACFRHLKATSTAQNAATFNSWKQLAGENPDVVLDFEGFSEGDNLANIPLGPVGKEATWTNLQGGTITATNNVASSPSMGVRSSIVSATLNTNEGDDSKLTFSLPVDYVGFYIIDLDDVTKMSDVTVTFSDNSTCNFQIDHTLDNCACQEFLGMLPTEGLKIVSVSILPNTGSRYGLDSICYGWNSVRTFSTVAATCNGAVPNNDGRICLLATHNSDKYGASMGTTYTGPGYAAASNIGALPIDVQTGVPNTGGTYTFRIFNGSDDCFKDTTVTVAAVPCVCGLTAVVSNYSCSNEGTVNFSDDKFAFDIVVNGGTGLWISYPLNGVNGSYGATVHLDETNLPSPLFFISNGGYTITVTDINNNGCTGTVSIVPPSSCSLPCPWQIGTGTGEATTTIVRNDSGTPANPNDDTVSGVFDLLVPSNGPWLLAVKEPNPGINHFIDYGPLPAAQTTVNWGPVPIADWLNVGQNGLVLWYMLNGYFDCTSDLFVNFPAANTCTSPSAVAFTQVAPSCLGGLPNNDGSISLASAANATHWGVSSLDAGSYDGPTTIVTANVISLPQTIQNAIPNTGGSYIVRIFNGGDGCYIDQTVTVQSATCISCPPKVCQPTTVTKN